MRLLIKIASRERPYQLLEVINEINRLRDPACDSLVLVSADMDDGWPEEIGYVIASRANIRYGERVSKIEAINRDLEKFDWDVVLVLADDMMPLVQGFDALVLEHMNNLFPDTDGCLWFWDNRQHRLCTIPCMGRKYWEEHGRRIYHPSYKSYFADDEQTELAISEGKMVKIEGPFVKDIHPMHADSPRKYDRLLRRNQLAKGEDRANYKARKALGFPQDPTPEA